MSVMDQIDIRYERDELTGLLSMDGIIQFIQSRGEDTYDSYSMVYMSIPTFKKLNLGYGYECGNRFLISTAEGIKRFFPDAYAARESSHHFTFFIPDTNVNRIKEELGKLQDYIRTIPRGDRMRLKAGIAQGESPSDVFVLLDNARKACSHAERHRASFQEYNDQIEREVEFQRYLLRNFDTACERGDLQPFYQPEIRVLSRECCGYEALARWVDPKYGMISPGIFIPLFEQELLIHRLDLHIIQMVCRDLRTAIDSEQQVVPVSINLSRVDFRMQDMVREIENCREEYDIPRHLLHIEITESAVAEDDEMMAGIIDRFRELGYQIWMDDFGSGYSSLNNLQMFHFDVLKIDISFLRHLTENPRTGAILASVINMAKRLGMETLAEGVETQEQYQFLLEVGCEKLQGFLFGRPMRLMRSHGKAAFRKEDAPALVLETLSKGKYYSRIGRVNLLSATPTDDELLQVKNRLPITVIETTDSGEIHFLYANEAYLHFLHNVQIENMMAANGRANEQNLAENTAFLRFARRAEASGRVHGELLINGILFTNDIMFIAREKDHAAFLVIVRILAHEGEIQRQGIELAEQYVLSSFFRVDLFEEDGTATNLYLDADQAKLTDLDRNSIRLVRQYAERYIAPEESESFCEFYDMETIHERVKKNGGHHVKKFFHSAIPGQEGRLEAYTIMPFRVSHHWKYLSCCQYAELPPREMLEEIVRKMSADQNQS